MGLPDKNRGRPLAGPALNLSSDDKAIVPDLDHFTRRLIQDALNDGRRGWWLKRAEDFERAKPRPGEFAGQATIEELRERWRWCHQVAQACRNKAALISMTDDEFDAEIAEILDEGVA